MKTALIFFFFFILCTQDHRIMVDEDTVRPRTDVYKLSKRSLQQKQLKGLHDTVGVSAKGVEYSKVKASGGKGGGETIRRPKPKLNGAALPSLLARPSSLFVVPFTMLLSAFLIYF
ncbi:hypothetical protein GIB67_034648 [Kingdonia uniflora]|uniref:Uncharacterized protein n=1 Tax=Kingdonia uniflora TaxID=39325 RepID=A0A7J7P026_9MAGN|nr:hypothetical protein GIB67_034648 [Kingdonia uniflora]